MRKRYSLAILYARRTVGLLLLLVVFNPTSAQNNPNIDPQSGSDPLLKPLPRTPDEASLFKFTQIPVSQSTGIPEISIPIYEIKMKGVSIPIRLRYHSGGIGVTETASSVGMGWALDCGGIVSQTIKGIDDFDVNYSRFYQATNMSSPSQCDIKVAAEHKQDSEPDIFSYSLGGSSGSFFLDSLGKIIQVNEQKVKIEPMIVGSNMIFPTNGWKITDLQGVQYFFGQVTYTTSKSQDFTSASTSPAGAAPVSKTWYLYKVVDQGGDSTVFKYDTVTTVQNVHTADALYLDYASQSSGQSCTTPDGSMHRLFVEQISVRLRLRSIQFPEGNVQFTEGGNRCDLYGDTYLGKIAVFNNQNTKVSEHDLHYQYMIGNQWVDPATVNCSSDNAVLIQDPQVTTQVSPYNKMDTRRLFLTEVDEADQNDTVIDSYKMSYENSIGLPGRYSSQQDFEGYYNGNGYLSLLQSYSAVAGTSNPKVYTISGRTPSLTYAKQGILTKLTYPTGGYSTFDYELNVRTVPTSPVTTFPAQNYSVAVGQTSVNLYNFTINDVSGRVPITITINGCTYGTSKVGSGYSIINSQSGVAVVPQQTYSGTSTNTYSLVNGSYTLQSSSLFSGCAYTISVASWSEHQSNSTVLVNQNYGGLRIKDIQTYDPVAQSTLIRAYNYNLPTGLSSLTMYTPPIDTNYQTSEIYLLNDPYATATNCVPGPCGGTYTKLTSSSHYVVATPQNGLFAYTYVTEKDTTFTNSSPADNGYTVYQFENGIDDYTETTFFWGHGGCTPSYGPTMPYAIVMIDQSWARGKMTAKDVYRHNTDNTYSHINSEKYYYSLHYTNSSSGVGYTTEYQDKMGTNTNTGCIHNVGMGQTDIIQCIPYKQSPGYQTLDSALVQTMYANQATVSTATYYTYNANNLLPSSVRMVDSKGGNIITNMFYPLDYNLSGTPNNNISTGIKNLQSRYVISPIIEQYEQRSNADGTNLRTFSASLTGYQPTIPFPDTAYRLNIPQAVTNFVPTAITTTSVTKDSRYEARASFNQYDAHGNIQEQQKINDTKEVYLWGYNQSYPVAKIVGSDYATVSGIVTQTQIDAATATANNDASVRTLLNNLRSGLPSAQVFTYTYTPLLGMTSSTDAKGETTYYEYDTLLRLMNIKNKDGNIIKHYDYHYQGQ